MVNKKYAIVPDRAAMLALEAILYPLLVTEDGVNFKNGFNSDTQYYLPLDAFKNPHDERRLFAVTNLIIEVAQDNQTIADAIATQYTLSDVKAMGWFPQLDL